MIISRACNCDCNNFKTSALEVTDCNVEKKKTFFLNIENLHTCWLKLNLETRRIIFQIHTHFEDKFPIMPIFFYIYFLHITPA